MAMKTWRIRSRPHHINRAEEFLDRNLVAVGWGLLPDLIGNSPQQIRALLSEHYPDRADSIGADQGQLRRLVIDIKMGDCLVVSGRTTRDIHLGVVTGPYRHQPKNRDQDDQTGERGFQHGRPVRWLLGKQSLPIEDLPREMRDALRARQAIVAVRGDHSDWFRIADDAQDEKMLGGGQRSDWSESLHRSQDGDDAYTSLEGTPRLVLRRERLREVSFRAAKIAATKRSGRKVRCEVEGCEFEFSAVYGDIGVDFIHVHHLRRLADYTGVRTLDDLLLVCPNCHAMIHAGGECRDPNHLISRPYHRPTDASR